MKHSDQGHAYNTTEEITVHNVFITSHCKSVSIIKVYHWMGFVSVENAVFVQRFVH